MSRQVTTTLVNTLGSDHDAKVIKWRESLLEELGTTEEIISNLAVQYKQGINWYNYFWDQLNPSPHGALIRNCIGNSDENLSLSSQSQSSMSAPSFSSISSIESHTSLESDMKTNEAGTSNSTWVHMQITGENFCILFI